MMEIQIAGTDRTLPSKEVKAGELLEERPIQKVIYLLMSIIEINQEKVAIMSF